MSRVLLLAAAWSLIASWAGALAACPVVSSPMAWTGADAHRIPAGTDAATLDALLSAAGLRLDEVREGAAAVPRVYAAALPRDLGAVRSGAERKRIFIKIMLPLALAANDRIGRQRAGIACIKERVESGGVPTMEERRWLDALGELYRVDDGDLDDLLVRVDLIPPSLALAQAAQESGWGTSRFAREGHAVYGQRTWQRGSGMVPLELDRPDFGIRVFDGLASSLWAYTVNLNRHWAYADLRALRATLRALGKPLDGMTLANGLDGYAEEAGYVAKLRVLMWENGLVDFDGARLVDAPE